MNRIRSWFPWQWVAVASVVVLSVIVMMWWVVRADVQEHLSAASCVVESVSPGLDFQGVYWVTVPENPSVAGGKLIEIRWSPFSGLKYKVVQGFGWKTWYSGGQLKREADKYSPD